MTCNEQEGYQEWTFELVLDRKPNEIDSTLSFCLKFGADGKITGEVFDLNDNRLSSVTGKNQPYASVGVDPALSLMSLDFSMNGVSVTMSGTKLGPAFEGRLRAFVAAGLAAAAPSNVRTAIPLAPSDGDTGTATGSQT